MFEQRRRMAMILSLFAWAIPGLGFSQTQQQDQGKDQQPSNVVSVIFEAVDKYHGSAVGGLFEDSAAPRLLARYTRTTSKGHFWVDSWNSAGKGFNLESDAALGFTSRQGFEVFYAQFFVRGGDIGQVSVAQTVPVKLGGKKASLTANLLYYFGTKDTSPPGGYVAKLSSATSHKIPGLDPSWRVQHRYSISADNNPFGLGEGWSGIGFYTAELGFRSIYAAWNLSTPLAGRRNTSRAFLQSFSAGYRYSAAF